MTDSIFFMHYRDHDAYGYAKACGGRTLAISIAGPNTLRVALAQCSKKDAFNKKMGRQIALGRLLKSNEADADVSPYVVDITVSDVSEPIKGAVDEAMSNNLFSWVRR